MYNTECEISHFCYISAMSRPSVYLILLVNTIMLQVIISLPHTDEETKSNTG